MFGTSQWGLGRARLMSESLKANKKRSPVSGYRARVASASDPRVSIFNSLFFICYETMATSSCSQNCWIDGISAVLCFKRLFHIVV